MKGINLSVYSNPKYRGCAAGGISEKFDELLIAHDKGYLDINGDEENLVQLVHRVTGDRDVYHLAPMGFTEMHGVYGALAIHDRREW